MKPVKLLFVLLSLSFSLNAQNTRNINEELISAVKRSDVEAVKTLIAGGANVNHRANYGATPLHFACDRGNLEIVKALVEAGADVNAKDDFYKFTPMMMAMSKRHRDVIGYLQQAAAKSVQEPSSGPPQTDATTAQAKKIDPSLNDAILSAAKQGKLEEVKSLLGRGADVNAKTNYNQTPLMLAAGKGYLDIVRTLIDAGADLNVVDTFYRSVTALGSAADNGHAEIAKLLLEKGANSSTQALISGVQNGHVSIVKIALDKGGISQQILDRGLSIAKADNNEEIISLLTKAGAVLPESTPVKPEVKVEIDQLKKYVGTYRLSEERQFSFIISEGKLSAWDVRQYSISITPIDINIFRIGNSDDRTITFNEENGRVTSMTLKQSGFSQTYNRVEGK